MIQMRKALLVTTFAAGLSMAETPAPVMVHGGLLQGTFDDGLTVYKGVPFAAPPVDGRRWRAPQPAAKWEGVRQAANFGPSCMQAMPNPSVANQGSGMSEDCLYLNVWTPAKSAKDRVPFSFGSAAAGSARGPHPYPPTAGSAWRRRAWC